MVPVTLRLKNFMSYGADAPVLNFELFHTACLSGNNGQGKSALLDAITWSLWGKARKATGQKNPSHDLLRVGHKEMQVEYVFDIEGVRYRIIRTYNGEKNRTSLELHGKSEDDQRYRLLSGRTMVRTQEIINNVVRLEYETFISSALLLQGKSDAFANKSPSQRKEVLASILNLERYETLLQLAKENKREAANASDRADDAIKRLEKSVERASELNNHHEALTKKVDAKEDEVAKAREEEASLISKQVQLRSLNNRIWRLQEDLAQIKERLQENEKDQKSIRERITQSEKLLQRSDQIRNDFARMRELQRERQIQDQAGVEHRDLERSRITARREYERKRHQVELDLRRLENKISFFNNELEKGKELENTEQDVSQSLEMALAAKRRVDVLKKVKDCIDQLDARARDSRRTIDSKRVELLSQSRAERKEINRLSQKLVVAPQLKQRARKLEKLFAGYHESAASLEKMREDSLSVVAKIKVLEGKIEGFNEQRKKGEKTAKLPPHQKRGTMSYLWYQADRNPSTSCGF